jgi:phage terminase small subunit
MARQKKTEELNPKQELFCQYYAKNNNALQSYLKVYDCTKEAACAAAYRLLDNVRIKQRVAELKAQQRLDVNVTKEDLIIYCLKVIGCDLGEYLTFKKQDVPVITKTGVLTDEQGNVVTRPLNVISVEDSTKLDTSIITEVKQGRDGISFKLEDKRWAWEKLEKYLGFDIDSHVDGESAMQSLIDSIKRKRVQ